MLKLFSLVTDDMSLSTKAIVGIVLGVIVLLAIIGTVILLILLRAKGVLKGGGNIEMKDKT